jgi:lipid II:glycine glycyltransferase (peptidoglycan interpeptide bridge formation enzyme)
MTITEISDTKLWQEFVSKLNLNTFLHSQNWANFNRNLGDKIWQFGMFDSEKELQSVCLVILIDAKRGKFLLVPHGPQIPDNLDKKFILKLWKEHLTKLGNQENCSFIRIQPIEKDETAAREMFKKLNFIHAPIHMHTELTSLLDIDKDKKDILLAMRKTTRQMIKKAEKMLTNAEIELEYPEAITEEMHDVYKATYKRGGAVAYSEDFLNKEWVAFKHQSKMFVIRYQGEILSWGMILISGRRAFYHQGGNILNKNVPSSYFLQWQGIQFSKDRNCITYDFWGVSPKTEENHPWANISLFKRGFGGDDVQLLHAQDLVLNWKYWLNWAIEKIRAKKRGFKD